MATVPTARWDDLLSTRARIGWTGPGKPSREEPPERRALRVRRRPARSGVVPVRWPARSDGPDAPGRGRRGDDLRHAAGLPGPARAGLPQVRDLRGALDHARTTSWWRTARDTRSRCAFSAFVDIGDAVITEAPTFSGTLNTIRRHGAEIFTACPLDDEGIDTDAVRARLETLRKPGPALQDDLHDRQLPEPGRPDDVAAAAPGACRAGRRVQHADPGGRRLR